VNGDHFVDEAQVKDRRHEAGAHALDAVRALGTALLATLGGRQKHLLLGLNSNLETHVACPG
jgi:hypothetical protein